MNVKLYGRFTTAIIANNVARGSLAPPLAWKVCKIAMFLVHLRPIFAPKMKTAPSQRDLGAEVLKHLPLLGPEYWSFLVLELT